MKPITKFVLAAFAVTMLMPGAVLAQSGDSKNQGYVVDQNGNIVTSAQTGLCWRTIEWTPARAKEPCDRELRPVAAVTPAPAPKPAMVAQAPVAPTPKAAPQPVVQKITFSGDALFAFNKSDLKPDGKTMLDDLVRQLDSATTYETIIATGHTDRFGSNAYNQKLSERRAQTVKDYLVAKNVQAGRIDAVGKGETQPLTKVGDCKGPKSPRVIACLQIDRRVDVEMKGTKNVAQ